MELLSPYLLAGALGWLTSQCAKYVIASVRSRKVASLRQLYLSGNMPSAHSATIIAVLTVIGFNEGVTSALFGLGAVMASIVLYDAMMVRRSSGEQGAALTALLKETGSKVPLPRVAKGHTPLEVAVGTAIGLVIGCIVSLLTLSV